MFGYLTRRRRRKIRSLPFPRKWLPIVERNFPYYARLQQADRKELLGHIQVFLDEKRFEGCGGLEITEEIEITIAAQACLLLLHRETDYYPKLATILVYPSAYIATVIDRSADGVVSEQQVPRRGEAWQHGIVVLAWDAVRRGATDIREGQNVVLHEFAHILDYEAGGANGAPSLERPSMYAAWGRVLGAEYEQLRLDSQLGRETVLDQYGATAPAEFFAVATECFFEKPVEMKRDHPELYEELTQYYKQDPVTYRPPEPSPAELPDQPRDLETIN